MSSTQTARAGPCNSSDVGLYHTPRVGRTTGRGAEAFIHIAHRHAIAATHKFVEQGLKPFLLVYFG